MHSRGAVHCAVPGKEQAEHFKLPNAALPGTPLSSVGAEDRTYIHTRLQEVGKGT